MHRWATFIRRCWIRTCCGTWMSSTCEPPSRMRAFDDAERGQKTAGAVGALRRRAADSRLPEVGPEGVVGADRQVQEPHLFDSNQAGDVPGRRGHLSGGVRGIADAASAVAGTPRAAEVADPDLLPQMPRTSAGGEPAR